MGFLGRISVRRKHQILGLCLLSIALFLSLALATRDGRDTAADLLASGAVRNQAGVLGALAATGLARFLGAVGAWAIPLALLAWGWNRLRLKAPADLAVRTALAVAALWCGLGLLYLISAGNRAWAGMLGEWIGAGSARLLGRIGAQLALGTSLIVVTAVAFELGDASPIRRTINGLLGGAFGGFLTRFGADAKPKRKGVADAKSTSDRDDG